MDGLKGLSVFDDAVDGVVAFADDNRYVYANPAALQLFERPALVGHIVGCFAAAPIEDRMKRFRVAGSGSGEVAIRTGGGGLTNLSYRGITNYLPDLHLSVFHAAASTPPEETIRTGPRAALFQAVFEHSPDAVLLADDERRYLAGNSAARRFLGVSRKTLQASRIDDFTPPGMFGELERAWEVFLTRGSMEGVFPMLLPNGLQRTVLLRAVANITPGRHLTMLQVLRRDHPAGDLALKESAPEPALTFREREVLTWLARGATGTAIAEQASLSPETVRTHTRNAMRKLGAHSRPHAIALAMQQRQIEP
jgi:DNA-binding CsgD family transcriptional regulator/PAS domain-containing protein